MVGEFTVILYLNMLFLLKCWPQIFANLMKSKECALNWLYFNANKPCFHLRAANTIIIYYSIILFLIIRVMSLLVASNYRHN